LHRTKPQKVSSTQEASTIAQPAKSIALNTNDKVVAMCSGTPGFGYPQASQSSLYSQVVVVCCDGSSTTSTLTPCSDHQPAVASYITRVFNNVTGELVSEKVTPVSAVSAYRSGSSVQVDLLFNDPLPGSASKFNVHNDVEPFGFYTIQTQIAYTDGSVSQNGNFPTKLVTSPFVSPQYLWTLYNIPQVFVNKSNSNSQVCSMLPAAITDQPTQALSR
jgi:hypothetical protein